MKINRNRPKHNYKATITYCKDMHTVFECNDECDDHAVDRLSQTTIIVRFDANNRAEASEFIDMYMENYLDCPYPMDYLIKIVRVKSRLTDYVRGRPNAQRT